MSEKCYVQKIKFYFILLSKLQKHTHPQMCICGDYVLYKKKKLQIIRRKPLISIVILTT